VLLLVLLRWLWLLREWRVEVLEDFCVDDIERHGKARRLVGERGVGDQYVATFRWSTGKRAR